MNRYIMKDQVRNQIGNLMAGKAKQRFNHAETKAHLVSVAVVCTVYVFSLALNV